MFGKKGKKGLKKKILGKTALVFDSKKLKGAKKAFTQGKPEVIKAKRTVIDSLMRIVQEREKASFKDLSKELGLGEEAIERIGKVLERQGLVDVQYPTTMFAPRIVFKKALEEKKEVRTTGKVLEKYELEVDFVPAEVMIVESKEDKRPFYNLNIPFFGVYTETFLKELKEEIAEKISLETEEISDIKQSKELKEKFFNAAKEEIGKYLSELGAKTTEILAGILLHEMYGLGKIEIVMGDNFLEEVAINSAKDPLTVYHRNLGWMKTNIKMPTEEETANYASQIGRKVGRQITTLNPILDAHLTSGDRVNSTFFPISTRGNTITIRRFSRRPWTIVDFIGKSHTMNIEMASLLWMAMQYELSVVVAGGTGSGKTSALNAFSAFMPSYHRIISIEDVREIVLPDYMQWNWVPLTTRNPNPEGMGEVSMLHLMQSSLRMRPDRIILGEMRKRKEAEVLFEAMHTGHSVYSTIHANSANQVLRRLTEPPIEIPAIEVEALDLLIVQYRDRRSNVRRTYEIAEIESAIGGELSVNTVFKWDPRTDDWETLNPASRFVRQINLHTGMTEEEINKDLQDRASILQWMLDNKLSELNQVGKVMKLYYSDANTVKQAAKKNLKPAKIL